MEVASTRICFSANTAHTGHLPPCLSQYLPFLLCKQPGGPYWLPGIVFATHFLCLFDGESRRSQEYPTGLLAMPQQVYRALRPMFKTGRWRICRDDVVCIMKGPERGETGRVLEVYKDVRQPQVIVEGRNLRKKKVRTGPNPDDWFVVSLEAPMHYSQVRLLDPVSGKPIRVVYKYLPSGERVRVRKVPDPTDADILPEPKEDSSEPRAGLAGAKDTPQDLVHKYTYGGDGDFRAGGFHIKQLESRWLQAQRPGSFREYSTCSSRGTDGSSSCSCVSGRAGGAAGLGSLFHTFAARGLLLREQGRALPWS